MLANDILIVAIAPLLIAGAQSRGLDPRPFAIALAASTNAGSAATLIGNPQNILLGAIGRLDFWHFLAVCAVPALFALLIVFTRSSGCNGTGASTTAAALAAHASIRRRSTAHPLRPHPDDQGRRRGRCCCCCCSRRRCRARSAR